MAAPTTPPILTLSPEAVADERQADEARHRGPHEPWSVPDVAKYRNALEGYVPSVKPGNQTALHAAAVPFAHYLNGMHNRIHPYFADSFLTGLDGLPKTHPLNSESLTTRVEIALSPEGHILRMGVVRTSGVTAFDVAALHSLDLAEPFGPTAPAIRSPDGNVYLHWEFFRDEVFACSTMHARPSLLRASP